MTGRSNHDILCWGRIDTELSKRNTQLSRHFSLENTKLMYLQVVTEKVDAAQRGRPAVVMCTYCPFCGVKL